MRGRGVMDRRQHEIGRGQQQVNRAVLPVGIGDHARHRRQRDIEHVGDGTDFAATNRDRHDGRGAGAQRRQLGPG